MFVLFFTILVAVILCQDNWKFVGGTNETNVDIIFGEFNKFSKKTMPGGVYQAYYWSLPGGMFYLFGGSGFVDGVNGLLNHVFVYNVSSESWKWLYGEKGTNIFQNVSSDDFDSGNVISSRKLGGTWRSNDDSSLLLYGGFGMGDKNETGVFSDVWEFDLTSLTWRILKGPGILNPEGDLSSRGTFHFDNLPQPRLGATHFQTDSGKYMFGGGLSFTSDSMSDLWQFKKGIYEFERSWKLVKGLNPLRTNHLGIYPENLEKGVCNETFFPSSRIYATGWTYSNTELYLFGGKYTKNNELLADFWKMDLTTTNWCFIGGTTEKDVGGIYPEKYTFSEDAYPGTRYGGAAFMVNQTDLKDSLFLLGGYGDNELSLNTFLNDLWIYRITTGEWKWGDGAKGSSDCVSKYNTPTAIGGRYGSCFFTDTDTSEIYIFGGFGFNDEIYGRLNDMWVMPKPRECYGKSVFDHDVCSQNGYCSEEDNCDCFDGYYLDECTLFYCYDIIYNHSTVCSGNGACRSPDTCSCYKGFEGDECEIEMWKCDGIIYNDNDVCSGVGDCVSEERCECDMPDYYFGSSCQEVVYKAEFTDSGEHVSIYYLMPITLAEEYSLYPNTFDCEEKIVDAEKMLGKGCKCWFEIDESRSYNNKTSVLIADLGEDPEVKPGSSLVLIISTTEENVGIKVSKGDYETEKPNTVDAATTIVSFIIVMIVLCICCLCVVIAVSVISTIGISALYRNAMKDPKPVQLKSDVESDDDGNYSSFTNSPRDSLKLRKKNPAIDRIHGSNRSDSILSGPDTDSLHKLHRKRERKFSLVRRIGKVIKGGHSDKTSPEKEEMDGSVKNKHRLFFDPNLFSIDFKKIVFQKEFARGLNESICFWAKYEEKKIAAKVFIITKMSEIEAVGFQKELTPYLKYSKQRHLNPNQEKVVRCLGMGLNDNRTRLTIVSECMDVNLIKYFEMLNECFEKIKLNVKLEILEKICESVRVIHENGKIIIADLKPSHIMFRMKKNSKTCEYEDLKINIMGINKFLPYKQRKNTHYMASELHEGKSDFDSSVDSYSLAWIIYEVLVGDFSEKDLKKKPDLAGKIANSELEKLIETNWSDDNEKRYDTKKILTIIKNVQLQMSSYSTGRNAAFYLKQELNWEEWVENMESEEAEEEESPEEIEEKANRILFMQEEIKKEPVKVNDVQIEKL